jgi:hypothetical protein
MPVDERRNHARRAETMRTIVDRLIHARNGVRATDLSAQGMVIEAGATRILKRLMCRGLARVANGLCVATPVLLHAARVRQCAPDEELQVHAAHQQSQDEHHQRHRMWQHRVQIATPI